MPSAFDHHTDLFNRLTQGEPTPQDAEELIAWLGEEHLDPEAARLILDHLKHSVPPEQISPAVTAALEARLPFILNSKNKPALLRFLQKPWARYAAALIILLGASTYFLLNKHTTRETRLTNLSPVNDLPPGKNGAVLTLADGRKVVLDSLGNGVIATQNGSDVLLKNGQLAYAPLDNDQAAATAVTYNTMTTPKGRQFRLVLPDGTKIWLNAASSVRYPTRFTGKERKVDVIGEAYFEVAQNIEQPFIVTVNGTTEVQVLGTHFNINSYADEATINTTLLEGSVRIAHADEKILLQLGQQAQVPAGSSRRIKVLDDVNLEKVVAWKNGVFDFQDATLEEVMHQLERWYDIEVVYEKNIPKLEFFGKMGRDLTLSNVLRGLQLSKVHFRMEGERRLVILP